MTPARFRWSMIGVAVLAGAIQLDLLHARRASPGANVSPDGHFARVQAYWIIRGWWFVDPGHLDAARPGLSSSALHPPAPSLLLAAANAAGATGLTPERVMEAAIFVGAVVVAALAVRTIVGGAVGDRAGVLAALVVATYPALWVNPLTLGPETEVIAVCSLLLFGASRYWRGPSVGGAAEIGAYLGLAVLIRTDLVLLVLLLVVPLALLARAVPGVVRAKYLAIMVAVAVVIVAPWAARNLATFTATTLVSNDAGSVIAGANCVAAYGGADAGWWNPACASDAKASGDQSQRAAELRRVGQHDASAHSGDAIRTALIRLGRALNLYHPGQSASLEQLVGRPVWVSRLAEWYFYALVPLAIAGAVALRRRHCLLFPFGSLVGLSVLTVIAAYGDARYRVEADLALAMLAGVALEVALRRGRAALRPNAGRHSRHTGVVPVTP